MGAAISAFGFWLVLMAILGVVSIPGAMKKRRMSRGEDRFFRSKYRMEIQ